MSEFDKIIVVVRKTALQEVVEELHDRRHALFLMESAASFDLAAAPVLRQHARAAFQQIEQSHETYEQALDAIREAVPPGVRMQVIDRSFLPTFTFGEHELVVTLGPDGLVVNTAKYLSTQPILAFNPDPRSIDGVLLPFPWEQARHALARAVRGKFSVKHISMAQATLNDGQTLHAVNDLFLGQRTHVSARYELRLGRKRENQSSSGIIVSTGAGSSGWFRSVLTGAAGVMESFVREKRVREARDRFQFDWESEHLYFSVREPFVSKTSSAELVFGRLDRGQQLEVTSRMALGGVIFSDGIESDFLNFNNGAIARIGLAERKVKLIVGV